MTSAGGQYALSVVAGQWHVRPSPGPDQPYIYTGPGAWVTVSSTEIVSGVNFSLVTADATIAGTLVDEAGNPMTDAEGWASATHVVTPTLHNGAPIQAGTFTIFVPAGTYRVAAHLPPGSPYMSAVEKRVTVSAGASVPVTLTVKEKDARIVGSLWDPRNQDAVEGVDAGVMAWAGGAWERTAVNPGNGTYTLSVAAGLWHLGYRVDPQSDYDGQFTLRVPHGDYHLGATIGVTDSVKPALRHVHVPPDGVSGSHILQFRRPDAVISGTPAGALPVEGQVTLHVVPIATLPHQRHADVYRYGYAFTAVDAEGQPITEHFDQEVVIGFAYDERELRAAGISEFFLKPAYFSTTTNKWTFPESYVVDTEADRVVMQIDHFTDFALTGSPGLQVFLPLVLRQ